MRAPACARLAGARHVVAGLNESSHPMLTVNHSGPQLLTFTTLLAVACASDVLRRRIPNWVTMSVAVTGILADALSGGLVAAGSGLLALVVVGAVALPFWARRLLGGGDLKLAAAAAAWIGIRGIVQYLCVSAIAGAVLALVTYALASREARASITANLLQLHAPRLPEDVRAATGRVLVPYGVAFTTGALWAVWW